MQALTDIIRANLTDMSERPSSRPDQYFIYCVGKDHDRIDAFIRWSLDNEIGIKPLYGQYNGEPEESFISNKKDFDRIRPWLNGEETILMLGTCNIYGGRNATLKYLDSGRVEFLGVFKQVQRSEALRRDNYTYDPHTDCYFATTCSMYTWQQLAG